MKTFLTAALTAALSAALLLSACATSTPNTGANTGANTGTNTNPAPVIDGGTATAGNLTITGAWARPATAMQMEETPAADSTGGHSMEGPVTGAYLTIANNGAADKLLSVTTPVAEVVEIHQTKESNGMMMMEPVQGGLDIPANGSVEMKPGGYHLMIMNIKEDIKAGSTISLTLKFQSGQEIVMAVPVRENS